MPICLIAFHFDPGAPRSLLLAANRDEFHSRPSEPAHWWADPPILAGRDRHAGGTWLAVSRGGRVAAVTNVRELAAESGPRSRGELPVAFCAGAEDAAAFAHRVLSRGADYGGFNLLVYDGGELWWASNRAAAPERVAPGIHALSNHLLDTPWPKVQAMRAALADCDPAADDGTLFERLLFCLTDRLRPPGELPDTGIGREREELLAPAFVASPRYGTRCSTLLALSAHGGGLLEVGYDAAGEVTGRVEYRWGPDG